MWTFYFPELENLNFGDEICLEIEEVFKFDSLKACKGKKAWLGYTAKKSQKFKISS